jgi:uncharacterized membrane protein
VTATAARFESFSYPFFPPDVVRQLHAIRPDLVDKVLDCADREAEHRREMDRRQADFVIAEGNRNYTRRVLALVLSFVVALAAFGGATACGVMGHQWAAGVLATAGVGGVFGAAAIRQWIKRSDTRPESN